MLVSSESLKITSSISWFLRGLMCWMTIVGTVDVASPGDSPAQQRAEKRARSQSSGWLVTICLTCVVGQWLGVVGTKWRYLVFEAIRGGKGNGAVACRWKRWNDSALCAPRRRGLWQRDRGWECWGEKICPLSLTAWASFFSWTSDSLSVKWV